MTIAVLTEGGLLVLAIGAAKFFTGIVFISVYGNALRDILSGLVLSLPPLSLFIFFCMRPISFLGSFRQMILTNVRQLFSEARAVDIVLISLLAGIAEEFLFRGVVQARAGVVWASLIFGLFHFLSPAYFVFATAMGLYLGQLYIYFHGVAAPAAAHFAYDLGALLYLRFIYKDGCGQS